MQGQQYTVKRAASVPVRKEAAEKGLKSTAKIPCDTPDNRARVEAIYKALSDKAGQLVKTSQVKEVATTLPEFSNMTNAAAVGNYVCWMGTECPETEWIREFFEFVATGKRIMHIRVKAKAAKAAPARKGKAKAKATATQQKLPL